MGRVEGKVALVTGAASGLGAAAARMLAREGAKVAVTDRDADGAREVAAAIGEAALALELDVTDEAHWKAAVDATVAHFGGLDVLVNNAGIGVARDLESTTLDEWRLVHAVNLDGVFLGCREAMRVMKQRGGSIVNVSSVAGLIGVPGLVAYGSSKAAVRELSKSVALYGAKFGVRCNSIHPTFVLTPMVEAMMAFMGGPEKGRERLERTIPQGKLGEPDDVAYLVLYLASDESKLMTGAELVIDGGATAQ
jgi:3(or 17)beta-hydroxysteroid dehydrogenase